MQSNEYVRALEAERQRRHEQLLEAIRARRRREKAQALITPPASSPGDAPSRVES